MRKGFFGLISTAALIALTVAGCSTGGGTANDFELPSLPESTPTHKQATFTLDKYGVYDNAFMVVTTTGKDETYNKSKDIVLTSSYKDSKETSSKHIYTDLRAKALDLSNDEEAGGDEAETISYKRYRCNLYDSMKNFKRLVKSNQNSKIDTAKISAKFDTMSVGEIATLTPPSVLSANGGTIYVSKAIDDEFTANCNILIEVDENGNPVVRYDEEYLKKIAKAFDSGSAYFDNGIYKTLTDKFGSEWKYNPEGGMDRDNRVNIVFCSSEKMGGYYGSVRFCDMFSSKKVATSNMGEFIFLNGFLLSDEHIGQNTEVDTTTLGIIAHEFTHLIELNNKICQDGQFPEFILGETDPLDLAERVGISEGIAELGADLCNVGVSAAQNNDKYTGGADILALNDINVFLGGEDYDDTGFYKDASSTLSQGLFVVDSKGSLVNVYGASHLFALNLLKNFGIDNVSKFVKSSDTGMANIAKVLGDSEQNIYHDFWKSVYLSKSGLSPKYGFEYIKLGEKNYVRKGKVVGETELPSPKFIYDRKLNVEESVSMDPWSSAVFAYESGEESSKTLKLEAVIPYDAKVSLFRTLDGKVVEEVKGVEKDYYGDRER